MEECPGMYMVDSLETKEIKDVWGQANQLQKCKMNCLGLNYFWCNQKVSVQAGDIFDVLDYS